MFSPFFPLYRKQRLKRLAVHLAAFVIVCWVIYYFCLPPDLPISVWKDISFSGSLLYVAIALSALYAVLSICLYRGQEWAWWGTCFGFLAPVYLLAIYVAPFAGFPLFFSYYVIQDLFATAPRIADFLPSKASANLDETAHSLGLVWQDQPLWIIVQLAHKGELGQAAKQYRDLYHATWDQAEQTIKLFMWNDLDLKTHLLKEHVQHSHPA